MRQRTQAYASVRAGIGVLDRAIGVVQIRCGDSGRHQPPIRWKQVPFDDSNQYPRIVQ